MAIIYIASSAAAAHNDASGLTLAVTLGAAVAVGDVIVGMTGWDNSNTPTITVADNLGGGSPNVYTVNADQIDDGLDIESGRTFRCKVTQAGTPTITVTYSTNTGARRVIVAAYAGAAAVPFDTSKGNLQGSPGTGTDAVTSTAITTAENSEVVVGFHHNTASLHPGTGTITQGTGFTSRLIDNAILAVEDKTQDSIGSVAATFTISSDHATITHIVAIKSATVTPSTPVPPLPGLPWYRTNYAQD